MRDAPRVGTVIAGWAITFAIAGAAAGVIDGLWSWSRAAQHLPGLGGRLRWLGYLAVSHALAGAVVGAVLAALGLVWARATRLGDVARFAIAEHRARRDRDPAEAVAGLALVIAAVPCVAGALAITHRVLVPALAGRKHHELTVGVAMAGTLGALVAGALATFLLAHPIELGLRRLARVPALGRALSAPATLAWTALGLVALGGAVVLAKTWETARLLPLRPAAIAALALALAIGARAPALAIVARLARRRARVRAALAAGAVVALAALILLAGADARVLKAAKNHTGLGGPIARVIRKGFDWDGDGHARVLAGGDCDDGDAAIHPGAADIPGDGVDQNCLGGDPTLEPRRQSDTGFVPVPASVPAGANILLVTIDTLRADHLGAYGYRRPTSPAIDAFAAQGTRFANAWAHAPSTRYSMPAILTGRLPLAVPYVPADRWPALAPEATTVAEALAPLGFVTGAITNHWYFDDRRKMSQGFAEYDNTNQKLHSEVGGNPANSRGSSSVQQTDKAIAFVTKHAAARWFLWVHYYDPHYQYEAHPGEPSFGADDIARYDGEIRFTDRHIGRLLDDLRARGLYDRTIVVITGDHGEGFGEHGVKMHGYDLYAQQTKVPIVIRVPGLAPRVSTTPIGHTDLLPTLVNLAGGTPDRAPGVMGRSMVDVLAGAPDRDRPVFQQLSYENRNEQRGAAGQRCHVIYNVSPETSWEAYRVDLDPAETGEADVRSSPCAEIADALARQVDREAIPEGAADALLADRPAVAAPLGVFFGDEIELLSVEAPAQVKPGESFVATWTFATHGRLDGGWKVFAHFEQKPGGARFTGDHAPAVPFAWWKPGQFVRYTTRVAVPGTAATGTYRLWAGVWKGGERRPVRGSVPTEKDRADVLGIEVVR